MKRFLPLVCGLMFIVSAANAAAVTYQFTVNTSSIPGGTPGFIEFQFNQANGLTSQAATASLSGFTSTGFTFNSLSDFSLGGVTGSLSALPIVFDNTVGAANLHDAGVSQFGTGFSFLLTLDGAALSTPSTDGSQFFVYLLGAEYNNLIGPEGGIAGLTINGDTSITTNAVNGLSTVQLYTPPAPESVPEPGAFLLLGTGVAALFSRRALASRRG